VPRWAAACRAATKTRLWSGGGYGAAVGDEIYGQDDIEDADSADGTPERRVEKYGNQGWEMAEEIVLVPIDGPRQVKEKRTHLETEQYQQRAKNTIHE
jgi:hypothetical protein